MEPFDSILRRSATFPFDAAVWKTIRPLSLFVVSSPVSIEILPTTWLLFHFPDIANKNLSPRFLAELPTISEKVSPVCKSSIPSPIPVPAPPVIFTPV